MERHYHTTTFHQFAGETFLSTLDSGLCSSQLSFPDSEAHEVIKENANHWIPHETPVNISVFWGKYRECRRSFRFTSVLETPAFALKETFKIIHHSSLLVRVLPESWRHSRASLLPSLFSLNTVSSCRLLLSFFSWKVLRGWLSVSPNYDEVIQWWVNRYFSITVKCAVQDALFWWDNVASTWSELGTGPFVCTHRTHFSGSGQYASWSTRSGFWFIFVLYRRQEQGECTRCDIENWGYFLLGSWNTARIQTRWISCSMLRGEILVAQQNFSPKRAWHTRKTAASTFPCLMFPQLYRHLASPTSLSQNLARFLIRSPVRKLTCRLVKTITKVVRMAYSSHLKPFTVICLVSDCRRFICNTIYVSLGIPAGRACLVRTYSTIQA